MKIILENKSAIKLRYYTQFAKGEVSGIGKSVINEDGDAVVTDIALFDQECTGATTDIDDEALAKFMNDLHQAGESLADWNLWWHTHADMSVFWSSTDDNTIAEHSGNHDYLISIVTNKKGDLKGRLDVFPKDNSPFKKQFNPVKYDDLDIEVLVDDELKKEVGEKIEELEDKKTDAENFIEELNKQIGEHSASLLSDDVLEQECKEDVLAKVREKTYTSVIGNGKKKEGYYEKDMDRQMYFEGVLENIIWGIPLSNEDEYSDDGFYSYEDVPDEYDDCPECQNPVVLCACPDALEKYGHLFEDASDIQKLNKHLSKDYKNIINKDTDYGRYNGQFLL